MAEAKARASVQNDSSSTASVALGSESKNESSRSWEESGSLVLTKIERLRNLAPALSKLLADLVSQTSAQQSIVFIDDFYYIRTSDQAYVLDYLHQVCKGTNVWIKICGVGTRLRPYRDDDPPVGMEPENDIFRLSLDLTLEDFVTAKRFLEKVMDGILGSKGTVESFLSDTARDRIILASGGAVVRDYINLVDDALDIALRDKQKKDPGSSSFRIGAEHINTAASKRLDKKEEEDLAADAQEDHSSLRERWHHVLKFSRSKENTQFVLFRQDQLSETKWGAQVQQLQNLRLLHRITTAVPNTENWRGIKTVVVMIDLATAARQRLNQEVIPFWQGQAQMDRLRRAEWVYSPDFDRDELPSRTSSAKKKAPDTKAPTPTRDVGFQASLLDNGSGEDGR
jgi:hypothetical protein